MEIEKLKVADLRAALGGRGLDTKGTKPILVQRLKVILQKSYNEASGSSIIIVIKKCTQRKAD